MQKAKLFMTGGSQAVRLPAEIRFKGEEVSIRRDPATGDVVLSAVETLDEYFEWAASQEWPKDFLSDRQQPIDTFESPFDRLPARPERTGQKSEKKRGKVSS